MNQILKAKTNSFISKLSGTLDKTDLNFFLQISESGEIEETPFIKLINGDILFGTREKISPFY